MKNVTPIYTESNSVNRLVFLNTYFLTNSNILHIINLNDVKKSNWDLWHKYLASGTWKKEGTYKISSEVSLTDIKIQNIMIGNKKNGIIEKTNS